MDDDRRDDDRRDNRERREEPEEERRTDGRREERGKKKLVERARGGERIVVAAEDRRRYTPKRGQSRVAWRKSGGPSTKVKSMAARRRIRYEDEYDDEEDDSEEDVPIVVRRPRSRATARMHSSDVLRMSKPVRKKIVPPRGYYFESDESRSPSPQSTPPSKRRKEVKVREIRPKKKRPRTYMVLNSDSES